MKWPHKTKDNVMTFDASKGLNTFEWYINASFAVYPDFRSHAGGPGRFGGG